MLFCYEKQKLTNVINDFKENSGNVSSYIYNMILVISNYVTIKKVFYNLLESHGFIDFFNDIIKIQLRDMLSDFAVHNSDHMMSPELKILSQEIVTNCNNSITKNLKISMKKFVIFHLKLRMKRKEISKIVIKGINNIIDKKKTADKKTEERQILTDIKINVFKFVYGDNKDYKVRVYFIILILYFFYL